MAEDRHLDMAAELRDALDDLGVEGIVNRSFSPDFEAKDWDGRVLYLFPTTEQDAMRLSRRQLATDYGFAVCIGERYGDQANPTGQEPVPESWVDERVRWVRENVYTPLTDSVRLNERLIEDAWPQTCTWVVKYDPERLQSKVFWSVVELVMREPREG